MLMLLAALLVCPPLGTVLALQGGGGGTASGNVTALDGGLPPELDGLLALYRHGRSGLGMPTTFLLGGSPERSVAVGDLNGHGHADLVVSAAGSDTAWMLLGDGTGSKRDGDGDGHRAERGAGDVEPGGDQRNGGQHSIGQLCDP